MTGEIWGQIHDLLFTRIVVLPLGHRGVHRGFGVVDSIV